MAPNRAASDQPSEPHDAVRGRLAELIEAATGGDIKVAKLLGEGRTGILYQAEQLSLQRSVAVKVLMPRHAQASKTVSRFKREARAMAGCPHPGIVSVYNVGETENGIPFFVMEFIEGESLEERLARKGKLPLQEVVRIVTAVADALTYAHERGLVHRDVKPADVLIEQRTGRILITDFGLAKSSSGKSQAATLTGTGEILGTPPYLSPEQAECGLVDARSDQYSLAVMTFEMLAGRRPFLGPTPQDYVRQHGQDTPPNIFELEPGLPSEVGRVIERGLMKEPGARFSSCESFGQGLRAAASATPPQSQSSSRWSRGRYERRFLQAAVIYAGAAWGVLEALSWVLETFDLPMQARQPALWVVIGGFPLTLGLLWLFTRADRPT